MRRYRTYLKQEKTHTASCTFPKSFKTDCDKFLSDTKNVYAGSFNHLLEVSTRAFILSKTVSTGTRRLPTATIWLAELLELRLDDAKGTRTQTVSIKHSLPSARELAKNLRRDANSHAQLVEALKRVIVAARIGRQYINSPSIIAAKQVLDSLSAEPQKEKVE